MKTDELNTLCAKHETDTTQIFTVVGITVKTSQILGFSKTRECCSFLFTGKCTDWFSDYQQEASPLCIGDHCPYERPTRLKKSVFHVSPISRPTLDFTSPTTYN